MVCVLVCGRNSLCGTRVADDEAVNGTGGDRANNLAIIVVVVVEATCAWGPSNGLAMYYVQSPLIGGGGLIHNTGTVHWL